MWLILACSIGCGPTIHIHRYIFPNGFSGEFRIMRDSSVKSRLPFEDGSLVVRFASAGEIAVCPDDFSDLCGPSRDEYTYADGTIIHLLNPNGGSPSGHPSIRLTGVSVTIPGGVEGGTDLTDGANLSGVVAN